MARNKTLIRSEPLEVFEVLLEPRAYPRWVPGSRRTEAVDPEWPAPGSGFLVRFAGGMKADRTEVVAIQPPDRLVLQPHVWPLGATRVVIDLEPRDGGTFLFLEETFLPRPRFRIVRWAGDLLLFLRNTDGLRRLRRIVEARTRTSGQDGRPAA